MVQLCFSYSRISLSENRMAAKQISCQGGEDPRGRDNLLRDENDASYVKFCKEMHSLELLLEDRCLCPQWFEFVQLIAFT